MRKLLRMAWCGCTCTPSALARSCEAHTVQRHNTRAVGCCEEQQGRTASAAVGVEQCNWQAQKAQARTRDSNMVLRMTQAGKAKTRVVNQLSMNTARRGGGWGCSNGERCSSKQDRRGGQRRDAPSPSFCPGCPTASQLTHKDGGGGRLMLGIASHLRRHTSWRMSVGANQRQPKRGFTPFAAPHVSLPACQLARPSAYPTYLCCLQEDVVALVAHQHHHTHTGQAAGGQAGRGAGGRVGWVDTGRCRLPALRSTAH